MLKLNNNGCTGSFGINGAGCPGCCCPKCKKSGSACRDGGRYQCCGLCKDCGPCSLFGHSYINIK